jgi:hypothetical protein
LMFCLFFWGERSAVTKPSGYLVYFQLLFVALYAYLAERLHVCAFLWVVQRKCILQARAQQFADGFNNALRQLKVNPLAIIPGLPKVDCLHLSALR